MSTDSVEATEVSPDQLSEAISTPGEEKLEE
jgi:hypothetical protein